ncbi:mitochondrial inner membrane protein OXA1 [Cucumis melo var. makuwa]|uniref:Mitochondrial inner membrane protein OXA1 n=1 Tax=Cucumis melo var. makuwa TaxID=1194695 RepID=A0A5D3CXE7_CUCMM|nr:mitochondrial inner membrane protein OXA1 [Cucumis melo var. makuwa]
MAYRRSLCTRGNLIARQYHPSISVFGQTDDRKKQHLDEDSISHDRINSFLQRRSFGTSFNKSSRSNFFDIDRKYPNTFISPSAGSFFCRYMSSTIGEGSENIEFMSNVAEVLTDTTVQSAASQAAAANEVALAAADSFLPVKGVQYFIDAIHSFTGLNWASPRLRECAMITSKIVRSEVSDILVIQEKRESQRGVKLAGNWNADLILSAYLSLNWHDECNISISSTASFAFDAINDLMEGGNMHIESSRPHLEEVKKEMQEKGMDPRAVAEGQQKMKNLFNEFGVSPFTPLKGLFIQGPVFISFFLAVSNMAEKMPSFKNGGAYWFVDLTTPDTMYVFPVLTALTFWITVEYNMQEGMEGNPVAGTMKNVMRGLAIATVPLTMHFPKAIFCYWVTSNLFSLAYGAALKVPGVKKALGVPEIPQANNKSPTPQPAFSFFNAMKQATAAASNQATSAASNQATTTSTLTTQSSQSQDRKISSSSLISQRLRILEKEVKGRKKMKNKKK